MGKALPQRLKPILLPAFSARLKPCPFKTSPAPKGARGSLWEVFPGLKAGASTGVPPLKGLGLGGSPPRTDVLG